MKKGMFPCLFQERQCRVEVAKLRARAASSHAAAQERGRALALLCKRLKVAGAAKADAEQEVVLAEKCQAEAQVRQVTAFGDQVLTSLSTTGARAHVAFAVI